MTGLYELSIKFLLSAFLGGVIGAEREYRNKSAGFRTMIMISLGACFFTILSSGFASSDRIASNIVTGIGFIGAGVIFRGDGRISGITTAATIWAVSALGMGVGAGMYIASGIACLIILIVLAVLPFLEARIEVLNQIKTYIIECTLSDEILQHIRSKCKENHIMHRVISIEKHLKDVTIVLWTRGSEKNINALTSSFWKDNQINGFKVQGTTELLPTLLTKIKKQS